MPRFRFSLLAMFGFVAFVAVFCAALASHTRFWLGTIQAIVYVILVIATANGAYGSLNSRPFWLGFAVAGWGFLLANAMPGSQFLPTVTMTEKLQFAIQGDYLLSHGSEPIRTFRVARSDWELTQEIAQWLWSLVLGFIGGLVARHLYLRREHQSTSKPSSG
jgi:hypothetical protein